jgi:hypothetical protein
VHAFTQSGLHVIHRGRTDPWTVHWGLFSGSDGFNMCYAGCCYWGCGQNAYCLCRTWTDVFYLPERQGNRNTVTSLHLTSPLPLNNTGSSRMPQVSPPGQWPFLLSEDTTQPIKTHFMILLNYSKSLEQKLKKQSQRNWCRTEWLLNREKSNLLFFTVLQ